MDDGCHLPGASPTADRIRGRIRHMRDGCADCLDATGRELFAEHMNVTTGEVDHRCGSVSGRVEGHLCGRPGDAVVIREMDSVGVWYSSKVGVDNRGDTATGCQCCVFLEHVGVGHGLIGGPSVALVAGVRPIDIFRKDRVLSRQDNCSVITSDCRTQRVLRGSSGDSLLDVPGGTPIV